MFKQSRWDPIVVGLLIGCVSLFSFAVFHHTVGTTTTFVRVAAMFWHIFNPEHLQENAYYRTYLEGSSWINWQFAFVVGIFLGSYFASNKEQEPSYVPELWEKRFGPSKAKRIIAAFIGGVILVFGARLAGGCTSGHVIGEGMQLSVAGWLFMMAFFATALPTAHLLYSRK